MTCTACKSAEANPNTAEQVAGCMDCEARAIAQTSAVTKAKSALTFVDLDQAIYRVFGPERERMTKGRVKVWQWYARIEEHKWRVLAARMGA